MSELGEIDLLAAMREKKTEQIIGLRVEPTLLRILRSAAKARGATDSRFMLHSALIFARETLSRCGEWSREWEQYFMAMMESSSDEFPPIPPDSPES